MDKAIETIIKPNVSFDVFALSKEGYEIHVQLSGDKAYTAALKLLETMSKDGFTPRTTHGAYGKSNGNGKASANGQDQGKVCPVHGAPMRAYQNGKGAWHSHKLDDGTWCRGKAA